MSLRRKTAIVALSTSLMVLSIPNVTLAALPSAKVGTSTIMSAASTQDSHEHHWTKMVNYWDEYPVVFYNNQQKDMFVKGGSQTITKSTTVDFLFESSLGGELTAGYELAEAKIFCQTKFGANTSSNKTESITFSWPDLVIKPGGYYKVKIQYQTYNDTYAKHYMKKFFGWDIGEDTARSYQVSKISTTHAVSYPSKNCIIK